MASAGCRKNAGVPLLVRVAAIFRQMMPDLPMPVRIALPRQAWRSSTAHSNRPSRRGTSARIAAASVSRTLRASARSAMDARLASIDDGIERHEPMKKRLEQVQAECVLRIALRSGRIVVPLEKNAIDPRRDARRRQRLDVLSE